MSTGVKTSEFWVMLVCTACATLYCTLTSQPAYLTLPAMLLLPILYLLGRVRTKNGTKINNITVRK